MRDRIIEIGKDSIWYLVAVVVTAVLGFISIPIFTRLLTPYDYGIYSLVATTIVLISPLFYIWLTSAIVRFYPEYYIRGELNVLYSTAYHFLPHFLTLFAVAIVVSAVFLPLGQYRVIICLGLAIFALFTVFNMLLETMRARQMSLQYAVFYMLLAFGRYMVGVALVLWFGMKVEGLLWGWLGVMVLCLPIEFLLLSLHKEVRRDTYSPTLNREFLAYGFVLIFTTGSSSVLTSADRYIVEIFKGATQVGLYAVAYNLVGNVAGVLISFLSMAALPVIVKTYEQDSEKHAISLISKLTRYFAILLFPSMMGLWVLRIRIMSVVTSPSYIPAAKVVLPIALSMLLVNLAWLPAVPFLLRKKTKGLLVPIGVAAILNTGLNFLLIPFYGYVGAAWSTFICYAAYFALVVYMGSKLMKWQVPWLEMFRVAVATAVMALSLIALNHVSIRGVGGLMLLIVSGTIIFFAALAAVGGIKHSERHFAVAQARKLMPSHRPGPRG